MNQKHHKSGMSPGNKILRDTYIIRLQASMVLVLCIFVLVFFIFPRFSGMHNTIQPYFAGKLKIISIPQTRQQKKKLPRPALPAIPVAAEEMDVLEEVQIEVKEKESLNLTGLPSGPLVAEDLPYLPRQTLEVLPEACTPGVKGKIEVLVLVDRKGRVKNYRLLKNTTRSPRCLHNVIEALKKSRWEIVELPTGKVEYWIKKIYRIGEQE